MISAISYKNASAQCIVTGELHGRYLYLRIVLCKVIQWKRGTSWSILGVDVTHSPCWNHTEGNGLRFVERKVVKFVRAMRKKAGC